MVIQYAASFDSQIIMRSFRLFVRLPFSAYLSFFLLILPLVLFCPANYPCYGDIATGTALV